MERRGRGGVGDEEIFVILFRSGTDAGGRRRGQCMREAKQREDDRTGGVTNVLDSAPQLRDCVPERSDLVIV